MESHASAQARNSPTDAHDHVAYVIKVTRKCPITRAQQQGPFLSLDVVDWLAPDHVLAEVPSTSGIRSEAVLLNVGSSKEKHTDHIQRQPNTEINIVVNERLFLTRDMTHERNWIIPGEKPTATVRQHVSIQIVAK